MSAEIFIVSVAIERFADGRHDMIEVVDVGGANYATLTEAEQFADELRQRAYDMHESDNWKESE